MRKRRRAEDDVLRPESHRIGRRPGRCAMLPCVSIAPFGLPDVPDVKRMTAGSAAARSTPRRLLRQPAGYDRPSTTSETPASSTRSAISGGASSGLRGTAIAPIRQIANSTATNPGSFGRMSATRSSRADATSSKHSLSEPRSCEELVVGHYPIVDMKRGSLAVLPRGRARIVPRLIIRDIDRSPDIWKQ